MKEIDFEEFIEKYKPIKNYITLNRSYDELLFETYGDDLELVISDKFHNNQIWTLVDTDDEEEYIIPGYHIINRQGYFITEIPWKDENISINLNEMISVGKAKYTCIEFIEEVLKIPLEEFEDKIHDWFSSKF